MTTASVPPADPRRTTWQLVVLLLVALALPLQTLTTAWARAGGPAHVHVTLVSAWDTALHAHGDAHAHGHIGHHHHPADDPDAISAVWLGVDHGADAADESPARKKARSALDHDTVRQATAGTPHPAFSGAPAAQTETLFRSHVTPPPERPPRRA